MVDATRYGFRIRSHRNKRGWTQAELALLLGTVTRSAVAQWERGWTEPSKTNIQVLARTFNVPVVEMLPDFNRGMGLRPEPGGAGFARRVAMTLPQFDGTLLREAAELGIDVAAELSPYLSGLIRSKLEKHWLEENRAALEEANAFVNRLGLWSDGKRVL